MKRWKRGQRNKRKRRVCDCAVSTICVSKDLTHSILQNVVGTTTKEGEAETWFESEFIDKSKLLLPPLQSNTPTMSMHHPQAAEEARIRELRKKAEEEREAQLIRLQMQQQFERDKKIQQEKAEHEKELKKRARADEQMRAKKAEMHELQTRKIFEQQRREIEQKIAEREAKGEYFRG